MGPWGYIGLAYGLAAGESPEAIKAYFVERYGEWILLAPKREGFNLLPGPVDPATLERVRGEIARDRS